MNHISKSYATSDGRAYKGHSWETREGGFRRTALLVGNGLWPAEREERLIRFLLDRGFRVVSPELAFGAIEGPRLGLRAFRESVAGFAAAESSASLPLCLLASSCSAGALLPAAGAIRGLAAMALIAPVVDFPPPGLGRGLLPFLPRELAVAPGSLSGDPGLLEGLARPKASLRFRARDLRAAASDLASALASRLGVPTAFFAGDEDPFLTAEGRAALARAGAKAYGYPRVRHEPSKDRYADNFYADLGSFLDEIESAAAKKR